MWLQEQQAATSCMNLSLCHNRHAPLSGPTHSVTQQPIALMEIVCLSDLMIRFQDIRK